MKHSSAALLLIILTVLPLSAQEAESQNDPVQQLVNEAVVLEMNTSLIENEETSWSTRNSRLTLPGRPVSVEFQGSNIKIQSQFTPYRADDSMLLVAQAQVWIAPTEGEQGLKNVSIIRSIPVTFGERVMFFPIGTGDPRNGMSRGPVIRIEIQVFRYQDYILEHQEE